MVCLLLFWYSSALFWDSQKARDAAREQSAADHDIHEVEPNYDFSAADMELELHDIALVHTTGGPSATSTEASATSTEADDGEILQMLNVDSPARTTTTTRAPHSAPGRFVCLVSRTCVSCLLV